MSKAIYISGQITGLKKTVYEHKFNRAYNWLIGYRVGFYPYRERKFPKVIIPLTIKPFLGIDNWLCHIISDLWVLFWKCDKIYMLSNWEQSKGAKIEKRFAEWLGYDVYFER